MYKQANESQQPAYKKHQQPSLVGTRKGPEGLVVVQGRLSRHTGTAVGA